MALFGVSVVLLLLNLLIARFAKSFDLVYENLDSNFKVAFARVAIKGAALQAIPPPFNLLRLLVLIVYDLIERCQGALGAGGGSGYGTLQEDGSGSSSGGGDDDASSSAAHSSSATVSSADELEPSEHASIAAFLRRASSPEVNFYPKMVETWVARCQFDVSREERWRAGMMRQIGKTGLDVSELGARMAKIDDLLIRLSEKH